MIKILVVEDDPAILRGIVDNPRCITDEAAKALAAKGGVIGIQFGSTFNNPKYADWVRSRRPACSRLCMRRRATAPPLPP